MAEGRKWSVPEASAIAGMSQRHIFTLIQEGRVRSELDEDGNRWLLELPRRRRRSPLDTLRERIADLEARVEALEQQERRPERPRRMPPRRAVVPVVALERENGIAAHPPQEATERPLTATQGAVLLQDIAECLARHGAKAKTVRGWATQETDIGLMPRDSFEAAMEWAARYVQLRGVSTRLHRCPTPDDCECRCAEHLPPLPS